jgi:ribonucleoside-triphosphate reductase
MAKCGKPCEVWSRVTGYYRPVKNWNKGKRDEFANRKSYHILSPPTDQPENQKEATP